MHTLDIRGFVEGNMLPGPHDKILKSSILPVVGLWVFWIIVKWFLPVFSAFFYIYFFIEGLIEVIFTEIDRTFAGFSAEFDVTVSNKARQIKEMFDPGYFSPEFSTQNGKPHKIIMIRL